MHVHIVVEGEDTSGTFRSPASLRIRDRLQMNNPGEIVSLII